MGIVGTTFTGENEPIEEIAKELDKIQEEKGWDIPLHVDAASGGFVMPFTDPDLKWDFRIARVKSINASGHKFGLVYPGVGWVLWREQELLSEEFKALGFSIFAIIPALSPIYFFTSSTSFNF